ncbi:DUF3995 domain-containing protein [Streptomyces avidinii]|uniref:DUF3995 domain-containing protein n=1 Tax=Streptomyces avidinii TaxID=1895 RepID=UPI00386C49DF|nr:DUF3995 domain-containing protein [Streptomyces avidinii]
MRNKRTGTAVAGLLAADGLAHLYWATGATWPAADERALSLAVLGIETSFGPGAVLPLAAVLLTGATAVLARTRGRGGRASRAVTAAVAAGLAVRGLAGLGWAAGLLPSPPDSPFHALNLALYTPLCLAAAWAAARLAAQRNSHQTTFPGARGSTPHSSASAATRVSP